MSDIRLFGSIFPRLSPVSPDQYRGDDDDDNHDTQCSTRWPRVSWPHTLSSRHPGVDSVSHNHTEITR